MASAIPLDHGVCSGGRPLGHSQPDFNRRRRDPAQLRRDPDRRPADRAISRFLARSLQPRSPDHAEYDVDDPQAGRRVPELSHPVPALRTVQGNFAYRSVRANHGVIRIGGERGGWEGYIRNQISRENLPVWLQRAGYRTAHFGKFLNNYGGPAETTVPAGWERWVTDATDNSTREAYGYRQNIDGIVTEPLGDPFYDLIGGKDPLGCPELGLDVCNYHTDSMSEQAAQHILEAGKRPFYLQVDFHSPHGDSRLPIGPEPALRDYYTAIKTPTPHPPGYNEANVADKPSFLRFGVNRLNRER